MTGVLVRKDDHRALHTAEAVGGLGAVALGARNKAPEAADAVFRRVNARVNGRRLQRLGTTGALDRQGNPVDPASLSAKKGGRIFNAQPGTPGYGKPVGRRKSPREQAQAEYGRRAHPLKAKLARTTMFPNPRARLAARALGGPVLMGAGAVSAWHGARSLAPERTSKAVDRTDVDAAAAGGAAAAAGYWGPQYAYSQGPDKVLRVNRMKANPAQQERWSRHLEESGMRRGNHPKGDPGWVKVYRTYPKDLPGWRTQRAMSHLYAGRKGLALTAGATAAGAVLGVRHGRKHDAVPGAQTARRAADVAQQGARGVRERVRKDDYDLGLSPQYGVGIPSTRTNPISPLAMLASSNIMADAMIGASGKRIGRRQRKVLRGQAYSFNMGRGMVFSPLGHGQVTTG